MRRATIILAVITALICTASAGAAAGSLITSAQIKNNTITLADLSPQLRRAVLSRTPGPRGPEGPVGPRGPEGPPAPDVVPAEVAPEEPDECDAAPEHPDCEITTLF